MLNVACTYICWIDYECILGRVAGRCGGLWLIARSAGDYKFYFLRETVNKTGKKFKKFKKFKKSVKIFPGGTLNSF